MTLLRRCITCPLIRTIVTIIVLSSEHRISRMSMLLSLSLHAYVHITFFTTFSTVIPRHHTVCTLRRFSAGVVWFGNLMNKYCTSVLYMSVGFFLNLSLHLILRFASIASAPCSSARGAAIWSFTLVLQFEPGLLADFIDESSPSDSSPSDLSDIATSCPATSMSVDKGSPGSEAPCEVGLPDVEDVPYESD